MKQIEEDEDDPQIKVENMVEVQLSDSESGKKVLVRTQLSQKERKMLVKFLRDNQDVFAWSHKDMPGIDLDYMCHLNRRCLFCYRVMPFELKNARETYQRLMNKMFASLLGRIIEIYIDDMVIKSKHEEYHIKDLDECF